MDKPKRPVQYFQPEVGRMESVSPPEALQGGVGGETWWDCGLWLALL